MIGVSVIAAVLLPIVLVGGIAPGSDPIGTAVRYQGLSAETIYAIFICVYACIAFALVALFSLDLLLRNIKKDAVFCRQNIKCLRIISWCCFAVAVITLCGFPLIHIVLIFVSGAAAFFGLLMRVVKNVIDAACEIKDENDFTI